jgi:hypothetical protein
MGRTFCCRGCRAGLKRVGGALAIEIVEIVRRSKQGMTEPFICRGDDDALYFVKGRSAGPVSLIKEWVCGGLARALQLPIAPFEIVYVSEDLIDPLSDLRLSDLGAGNAFGSRQCEYTSEILFSQISKVSKELRRRILVFDRWIRNYDRTLSDKGGNPNLLWASDTSSLVMIDHNNAFDQPLTGQDFANAHIFGDQFLSLRHDPNEMAAYRAWLDTALAQWPDIVASVPPEWLFMDAAETVPVSFDFNAAYAVLSEHRGEGFWSW